MQAGGATRTLIDVLNVTKYPPSLLFLLMTLGPAAVVCGLADRVQGVAKEVLVTFGRVPFAFYVAHMYLIHLASIALAMRAGWGDRLRLFTSRAVAPPPTPPHHFAPLMGGGETHTLRNVPDFAGRAGCFIVHPSNAAGRRVAFVSGGLS